MSNLNCADQCTERIPLSNHHHLHHFLSSFLSEASLEVRKADATDTPQYTGFGWAVSLQTCPISSPHTATSCDIYLLYLYKQNSALLPIDHTQRHIRYTCYTHFLPTDRPFTLFPPLVLIPKISQHTKTQTMTSDQIIKVTSQSVSQC